MTERIAKALQRNGCLLEDGTRGLSLGCEEDDIYWLRGDEHCYLHGAFTPAELRDIANVMEPPKDIFASNCGVHVRQMTAEELLEKL